MANFLLSPFLAVYYYRHRNIFSYLSYLSCPANRYLMYRLCHYSQIPEHYPLLKQIIQLKSDGISIREIVRHIGISRNSMRKYLALLDTGSWELSNRNLADKANNKDLLEHDTERYAQLSQHFSSSVSELSKIIVTRKLLWQECIALHPDGYSYSR